MCYPENANENNQRKSYILVEPSKGIDFWEIIEGIGKLFTMDGFPQKNDIWKFREGPLVFLYEDIYKIKDFVANYYPKYRNRHKTHLFIEPKFSPLKPEETKSPEEISNVVAKIIKDENIAQRVTVISFDWKILMNLIQYQKQ